MEKRTIKTKNGQEVEFIILLKGEAKISPTLDKKIYKELAYAQNRLVYLVHTLVWNPFSQNYLPEGEPEIEILSEYCNIPELQSQIPLS